MRPQARAHAFRGLARLRAGRVREALEDLDLAVKLGPVGPLAPMTWKLRGLARAQADDVVGAIADLRRYVDLQPPGPWDASVAEAKASLDELVARLKR